MNCLAHLLAMCMPRTQPVVLRALSSGGLSSRSFVPSHAEAGDCPVHGVAVVQGLGARPGQCEEVLWGAVVAHVGPAHGCWLQRHQHLPPLQATPPQRQSLQNDANAASTTDLDPDAHSLDSES
eukprot:CAMPEP_0173320552 /NCGR_PEP_ID=MMETSP1143-20121109/28878_1 /TAXON_ID=483371 /ORGANISM="non described non described, Strain CCMP2298" /LENGTH=123 /DNA_ID=CAMNT_0014264125 /DNA_START=31 /DNA_END=406 /DNA_ORIENTATION=-